jgi:hypothetical protein
MFLDVWEFINTTFSVIYIEDSHFDYVRSSKLNYKLI